MPGIADLLYFGQPDPARQLAALLAGRQQAQQGAPPQNPDAPAPAAQPVSADPNAAPAPAPTPGAPPPANAAPQPTALQSTPDMSASYNQLANPPNIMNLYMQMDARNRASDQINHGLGLIAAHFSSPAMANTIMQSIGNQPDAGGQVSNLMSLYNAQNAMAGQQGELAQAPEIAAKTGYPEAYVRGEILAGRGGELMRGMQAPETIRSYQWAQKIYKDQHPDATQDEIDEGAQGILLQTGGGGDSNTRGWRQAKLLWNKQNPSQPYPWGAGAEDNPTAWAAWQGSEIAETKKQSEDQEEAGRLGPTYRKNLMDARKGITDIIGLKGTDENGNPQYDEAKVARLKRILSSNVAQSYLNADPSKGTLAEDILSSAAGFNDDDKELLRQIREATDPDRLIGGLNKGRAPKRGTADVSSIGLGLGGLRDVRKGYDEWSQAALETIKSIDTATMNSFGAQGEADKADDFARQNGLGDEAPGLIDESYLPGGKMYPKGKQPLPIPGDQLTEAEAQIKKAANPEDARQRAIKYFMRHNYNAKPLRDMVM